MKKVILLVMAVVMGGCSVDSSLRNEIRLGTFTFMPSESKDYEYVVNIKAIRDISYNTSDPEIRMMIVKQLLGNACLNPVIFEEQLIERINQPNSYLVKVSCK